MCSDHESTWEGPLQVHLSDGISPVFPLQQRVLSSAISYTDAPCLKAPQSLSVDPDSLCVCVLWHVIVGLHVFPHACAAGGARRGRVHRCRTAEPGGAGVSVQAGGGLAGHRLLCWQGLAAAEQAHPTRSWLTSHPLPS